MQPSKYFSAYKLVPCGLFLVLAACGGGSPATQESEGLTVSEELPFTQFARTDSNACTAVGRNLSDASHAFSTHCGGTPRDCDPIGGSGSWTCSSEQIGANAPALVTASNITQAAAFQAANYSCSASGSTLAAARDSYHAHCSPPLVDCDPLDGSWYCASSQIGNNSPARPETRPIDNTAVVNEPVDEPGEEDYVAELIYLIEANSGGAGLSFFQLPDSDDFANIPQDPLNPLSDSKVALGKLLYHDTSFALAGVSSSEPGWSCASCHHASAGFKAGIPQGIGEGGVGFGPDGTQRLLDDGFDASAEADATNKPDVQPIASPTILNTAYQSVMLWNGQFGNSAGGINATVDNDRLTTAGTPKAENNRNLSGLEIQAVAGTNVHRLKFDEDTPLQTNPVYQLLWDEAYPGGSADIPEDAAKAIAAFERTVLANRAPFQQFLRGDHSAMSASEVQGAILFFGKAGCVDCHRGPGLSSSEGASSDQMFFALGFDDFDENDRRIHGEVDQATKQGRGGFTGNAAENYQFKIPQLYNLSDAAVLGHGASFSSVREVIEYKNLAQPQNGAAYENLDPRFVPLGLSDDEINDLAAFLDDALNDPFLQRYQPDRLPTDGCIIVDDICL